MNLASNCRYLNVLWFPFLSKMGMTKLIFVNPRMKVNGSITAMSYSLSRCYHPPFPQIDVIGAMVTVWRVRGKIIRYVLCNIVRNKSYNCAQCNAHTHEQIYLVFKLQYFKPCVLLLCACLCGLCDM